MNGTTDTNERLRGKYRDYLRVLARLQLSATPRAKLDAPDIVQQTILHAHANRGQFRGATEAEWLGWLRAIRGAPSEAKEQSTNERLLAVLTDAQVRTWRELTGAPVKGTLVPFGAPVPKTGAKTVP